MTTTPLKATLQVPLLDLKAQYADIKTEIDQAVDTFYAHDGQGRKVEDHEAIGHVREALEQALVQPI